MQTIEERIEALERSNRRLRGAAVVCGMLLVGVLVVGVNTENESDEMIRATGFVLTDAKGEVRGVWGASDGTAALMMTDARSNGRLTLSVEADGQSLIMFYDDQNRVRSSWMVANDGDATFALHDTRGTARLGATVEENGATIQMTERNGIVRTSWSVIDHPLSNKAELGFYDRQQRRRLALFSGSEGLPAIVFLDEANPINTLGGWFALEGKLERLPPGPITALGK